MSFHEKIHRGCVFLQYTLPNLSQFKLEFQVEYQTEVGIPICIQIEIGIPSWIVDPSGECTPFLYYNCDYNSLTTLQGFNILIRCKWSHGSLVLQASLLKSEDWYRLSVFLLFPSLLTIGHSWYCFPSVPSVEIMTYDTVQKRAMASWCVVDTSHENKHPFGEGKCTSGLPASLTKIIDQIYGIDPNDVNSDQFR